MGLEEGRGREGCHYKREETIIAGETRRRKGEGMGSGSRKRRGSRQGRGRRRAVVPCCCFL